MSIILYCSNRQWLIWHLPNPFEKKNINIQSYKLLIRYFQRFSHWTQTPGVCVILRK